MPDKLPQPKQRVITIENLQGGWVSDYTDANHPREGQPNQYGYSFGMSTMRPGRKGHITPAEIFNGASVTDTDGDINSLPVGVSIDNSVAPNPEWYITGGLSGTAPKVVQVVSGTVTHSGSSSTQLPHTISAVSGNFTTIPTSNALGQWGQDIIIYNGLEETTTPLRMVLYSYDTSASGYVGMWSIDGGDSITDNFLGNNSSYPQGGDATLPAQGVPKYFAIGPDQILYMTNGNALASYDSTADQSASNGTWNHAALPFGLGWVGTSICSYGQEYVAVSIVKSGTNSSGNTQFLGPQESGDARVVLWNGADLDFSQLYYLDDWYCSAIKEANGILYAYTEGKNGTTKVKVLQPWPPYFQTVWEAPTSIVGHAPNQNQIELFNEMICWTPHNYGTSINGQFNIYGLQQTQTGYALHTPYFLYDGTNQNGVSGLLKNTNTNKLFVGLLNAGGYKLAGLIGDGQSNGSAFSGALANNPPYTELRTVIQDNGYRGTIIGMKAYFSNFGSDSSMLLSLLPFHTPYADGGSGTITGNQLAWNISTTTHPNITKTLTASLAEFGANRMPDISEFWLNIRSTISSATANFPALRKLEITVEEVFKP